MIRCPSCHSPTREVFWISREPNVIERRRQCLQCGQMVTTRETMAVATGNAWARDPIRRQRVAKAAYGRARMVD